MHDIYMGSRAIMSKFLCYLITILVLAVLTRADPGNEKEFGLNYTRILKEWNIKGLAVTVVSNDTVITRGFGYKDLFGSEVTGDTAFFVGSLTKAFTATLAVQQLEKHNIRLKDRINSYYGLNLATEEQKDANMLDLLAHRVGAGRYDFFWLTKGTKEGTNVLENPITNLIEVVYQGFRSTFIFSSLMYWAAGEAIEAIFSSKYTLHESDKMGNRTWCELVTKYVIDEIGMDETTCEWRDTGRDGIGGLMASQLLWNKTNYIEIPEGIADQWQNVLPASGLISSANDMVHWIKFNLKLKEFENLTHTLKHTHELYMGIKNGYGMKLGEFGISFYTYGYALGWYKGNYRGFSVLYHDGRLLAHQNLIWLIPEINFGVYIGLTGGTNDTIEDIILQAMYLTDRYSGNLSKPWLDEDLLVNWRDKYTHELFYPPTHPHMLEPLYTCNCDINKTNSQVRYCAEEHIYYELNYTYSGNDIHHPANYTNDLYGGMEIKACSILTIGMIDGTYQRSLSSTEICMKINKFIGEIQPTNLTGIYHVKPLGQFVYIQETVFQRPLLVSISVHSEGASFYEHVDYKVCGLTLDPEIPPLFETERETNFIQVVLPIFFIIIPLFLLGIVMNSHRTIYKRIDRHILSKIPYKLQYKGGFKILQRGKEGALLEDEKTQSERQKLVEEIFKPKLKQNVPINKDEEEAIFKGIESASVKNSAQVEIREDEELISDGEDEAGKEKIATILEKSKKVVFSDMKDLGKQDHV